MDNIKTNELKFINKFIQSLADETVKTLKNALDEDTYKKIELSVDESLSISDISSLKSDNSIYKVSFSKGIQESNYLLIVPEEALANIADVLTGGSGENAYKGSLSELEVNSILGLLQKNTELLEKFLTEKYTNDIAFGLEPKFFTKETEEYETEFNNKKFDFVINLTLKINDKLNFPIYLLFNSDEFKKILIDLDLLSDFTSEKKISNESISLKQISDIQIDITAELGRSKIPMKYALELAPGSLVELDTQNNSDIKVFANGIEVAQAQIVVVEDNFALRITKIISPEERLKSV